MLAGSLTEWLRSPETQALLVYLRQRQQPATALFLQGSQVPSEMQAKAAGCRELEKLLMEPPEKIAEAFANAARELKTR